MSERTVIPALVMALGLGTEAFAQELSSPVDAPRVTSHFSHHVSRSRIVRFDCTPIRRPRHRGTDFGTPNGTPVYAAADGVVVDVFSGCSNNGSLSSRCGGGFGNHVIIDHRGVTTIYAHLMPGTIRVRPGEMVRCGQRIANSGNSGRSTGPHLHFEVRRGNARLDPYGGRCSTQANSLWRTPNAPRRDCPMGSENQRREDSELVRALIPDEARVAPGEAVEQQWTLRNTGTVPWSTGTQHRLELVDGPEVGAPRSIPVPREVAPGQTVDFSIRVNAPTTPGRYILRYRMASQSSGRFGTTVLLRLRVSSSMEGAGSCWSARIRRLVRNGDCIQVAQGMCGAENCGWMRCIDGNWQCVEAEACYGQRYANPLCEPERECKEVGEQCSDRLECCGGLNCGPSRNGDSVCCVLRRSPCRSDSDCCWQRRCGADGLCDCVPEGQPAIHVSECCGSLVLRDGVCTRP
ncbi:MAG: peptidoglycan DD-metalloendopeptidase family protein [Sandaracinaceae bacterium]|nr:peptidoglycan DD-metalloendopeptidase family protein [Sandaracinaceae bacterium]